MTSWCGPDSALARYVAEQARRNLDAYRAQPKLVDEHHLAECAVRESGYSHRQLFELVQNAADAITQSGSPGRIEVVLTAQALYCANEGAPIDEAGVDALLLAHLSAKRGDQIGRFGIGFKSVLEISDSPHFYSRPASFRFDRAESRARIHPLAPEATDTPVLRIAFPIDPEAAARADGVLAELMQWASTVVKVPRVAGSSGWLSKEIDRFPAEFLLFSGIADRVTFSDRVLGTTRVITRRESRRGYELEDGGRRTDWCVFHKTLAVKDLSAEARRNAGALVDRRRDLPLAWAVPTSGRMERGRFWAFFPTETETTLRGIVNAPWRTNTDRQKLLEGELNDALLDTLVALIVEAWPTLHRTLEPPGRILELLPVREDDSLNWADRILAIRAYQALSGVPSVPGCSGRLRLPRGLKRRPPELHALNKELWAPVELQRTGPGDWVHPEVEERERRTRAERLGCTEGTLCQFLEYLAGEDGPTGSRAAVSVAAEVLARPPSDADEVRKQILQTKFILCSDGTLRSADQHPLLPGEAPALSPDVGIVHPELAQDPDTRDQLVKLGVKPVTPLALLDSLLHNPAPDWATVWSLVGALPEQQSLDFLGRRDVRAWLRVRVANGSFVPVGQALFPGPIAAADDPDNAGSVVDPGFHAAHEHLLLESRIAPAKPEPPFGVTGQRWYDEYRAWVWDQTASTTKLRPDTWKKFAAEEEERLPGPLDPVPRLSTTARIAATAQLLPHAEAGVNWIFRRQSSGGSKEVVAPKPPIRWWLERHGTFRTSLGPRNHREVVGRGLAPLAPLLPVVAEGLAGEQRMSWPQRIEDLRQDQLDRALNEARDVTDEAGLAAAWNLFVWCAENGREALREVPALRRGRVRLCSAREVLVTHDTRMLDLLRATDQPVVPLPTHEDVEVLRTRWGLGVAAPRIRAALLHDPLPLADEFPDLARTVDDDIVLQPSEALALELPRPDGAHSTDVDHCWEGNRLYHRPHLSPSVIRRLVEDRFPDRFRATLPTRPLRPRPPSRLAPLDERWAAILAAPSPGAKLVAAVGSDAVRSRLPAYIVAALRSLATGEPDDDLVARGAEAFHGVELFSKYQDVLREAGFDAPTQWAGGKKAREFVESFGLPPDYALFSPSSAPRPFEDVSGPVPLGQLHWYQEKLVARLRHFLSHEEPSRAFLSLPTGAGKTRVAVEALVEHIREKDRPSVLLWIAQTDELCEQAVLAWRQVWSTLGGPNVLRITRAWASHARLAAAAEGAHVVVATFQSLHRRIPTEGYAWLLDPFCVVIDEAHGSIAPSYTYILDQLGLTHKQTLRHLLGLSATPYRSGTSEDDETRRLARRYHENRLDKGVFDEQLGPYLQLQEQQILSAVQVETLEGGRYSIPSEDLAKELDWLPPSVEKQVGDDPERTERILAHIKRLPHDWPVLVFAVSVENARAMALRLTLDGVPARAIDGETPSRVRRHYIEEFRSGRIRVLTNHSVLAAGFDAPKTRAVYVARPVFSKGLYQQMIGRGLRGPKNGGTAECLVVNVQDNFPEYHRTLAFREFEHYWKPWSPQAAR